MQQLIKVFERNYFLLKESLMKSYSMTCGCLYHQHARDSRLQLYSLHERKVKNMRKIKPLY